MSMSLDRGRKHLERTHTGWGRICKLHTEKPLAWQLNPVRWPLHLHWATHAIIIIFSFFLIKMYHSIINKAVWCYYLCRVPFSLEGQGPNFVCKLGKHWNAKSFCWSIFKDLKHLFLTCPVGLKTDNAVEDYRLTWECSDRLETWLGQVLYRA